MTKKATVKPTLVKIGYHYIDPNDVASITKCRKKVIDEETGEEFERKEQLYVVKLKSNPNPEFPIWVVGQTQIQKLLDYFDIE
jgi:hypothetical protein